MFSRQHRDFYEHSKFRINNFRVKIEELKDLYILELYLIRFPLTTVEEINFSKLRNVTNL